MITSLLLFIVYSFVFMITAPLRLLPNASLPANITSAISTASTYLTAIDFIFPVSSFITIFALILAVETFIILWKIINWIIKKVPTIS